MEYKDLILDYEAMLLGNATKLPARYFKYTENKSVANLNVLIRYLVENIMQWDINDAKELLSFDILDRFMLASYINKYVTFIPGMSEKEKVRYLLHLCYPKEVSFSKRKLVQYTYEKILNGEEKFWPKKYFQGQDGVIRSCICLQYLIYKYYPFSKVSELYELFSDKEQAIEILSQYKLKKAYEGLYENPLDFFHYSLNEDQRDNFLYHYLKFKNNYSTMKDQLNGIDTVA